MKIPIGNAIFDEDFRYRNINKKIIHSKFSKNLNFQDVDKIRFPAIRLKPILNKYVSMPIVLNAANEIFVDQFLKKNISFYSIINYLTVLLQDQKLRKYAIKKPSNLKTILLVDDWARKKAMQIISEKKFK
jgi:1-deoxy-D-xylulose-5-phosphate reductoisomerase